MEEETIEYQVGAKDIDTKASIESEDFIPMKMETRAVFHRLADDIYSSPESGIREALTNGFTAVQKSIDNGYIDESEGVIDIKIIKNDDNIRLHIQDNGIGITRKEVKEVVSHIGRSTVRDDYNKTGQFGMGFLALFKLSGTDGGFVMRSNSRKPNTEPIEGIWKNGGFTPFDTFSDKVYDMQGTEFEITVKNSISLDDLRNWIERLSYWSRVPVLYEENDNGLVNSEEFGVKKLESVIPEDEYAVIVENKYFKAICGPNLKSTPKLLLDVPIEISESFIPNAKWDDIAIRLKTENPIAITGNHKGKMVVTETTYKNMSDKRKKQYVPDTKLNEDDIVTPEPIGTREKLLKNTSFWSYVGILITEEYNSEIKSKIKLLDEKDLTSYSKPEIKQIVEETPKNSDIYDNFSLKLKSKYGFDLSDKTVKILYACTKSQDVFDLELCIESHHYVSKEEKSVIDILFDSSEVYMYINQLNERKIYRLYYSDKDVCIVQVPNSAWYEFYEDIFDWNRVTDVTKDHPITDSLEKPVEYYMDNYENNDNLENNKEKYYNIKLLGKRAKYSYDELYDIAYRDDSNSNQLVINNRKIKELIVFNSKSEYNISDYTWWVTKNRGIVNTKNTDDINLLKDLPLKVNRIEDEIEKLENIKIRNGKNVNLTDLEPQNTIIHIITDELKSVLENAEYERKMENLLKEGKFSNVEIPNKENYVFLTEEEYYELEIGLSDYVLISSVDSLKTQLTPIDGPNKWQSLLYIENYNIRDSKILEEIDKRIMTANTEDKIKESIICLINTLDENDIDLIEVEKYE